MSRPTKVLVVDDDPDFREFTRIVLESHGLQVFQAGSAPEGLALMRDIHPDVVLLDAMMSYELAGIGIIHTVRSDPDLKELPIILISAVLSQDEDRFLPPDERALVDHFLTKPITPDALVAIVQSTVGTPASPDAQDNPVPGSGW